MTPIQYFLVIFFIFAISRVILRGRQNELSKKAMLFWIIFWLIAGVVVISPDSTFYFARLVGVARGADLIVYVSLALLFFALFRLMVKQGKSDREITELTRQVALRDKKNNL